MHDQPGYLKLYLLHFATLTYWHILLLLTALITTSLILPKDGLDSTVPFHKYLVRYQISNKLTN